MASDRRGSESNPAVGSPGMTDYHVKYEGPHTRVGLEGVWYRRMEFWKQDGEQMGAWRWVSADEVPGDA